MKLTIKSVIRASKTRSGLLFVASDATIETLFADAGKELDENMLKSNESISLGGISINPSSKECVVWTRSEYVESLDIRPMDVVEIVEIGFHKAGESFTGFSGETLETRKDGFHWNKLRNPKGSERMDSVKATAKAEAQKTLALASELGISKQELADRMFGSLLSAPAPKVETPTLDVK